MENSKIILVEDNKDYALKIKKKLENLGYDVPTIVSNGTEAITNICNKKPDLVIVDLELKGDLDGIETASKINEKFVTPILYLSSAQDKEFIEKVKKTNFAGYIFKPINDISLYATIEDALFKSEKSNFPINIINIKENFKNNEISNVVKFQKSILPNNNEIIDNIKINWLFYPSKYGSGDIFNFFKLGNFHIGFFILDVMGHGFNAAVMSTSIQRYLSPYPEKGGILKRFKNDSINNLRRRREDFLPSILSPQEVLMELNKRFYQDYQAIALENNFFFTIVYGMINTITYEAKIARAGHHYPIYQDKDGKIKTIKSNGTAIGVFQDINIDEKVFMFNKGSRLILYSDGLVEMRNGSSDKFSTKKLYSFIKKNRNISQDILIENLKTQINNWVAEDKIKDDIVFLTMEMLSE